MLAVKISQKISDYVRQISRSSVKIEAFRTDGTGEVGAGFFVAPNIIVTCAHVMGITQEQPTPALQAIKVTLNNESAFSAQLVDFDLNLDVAVLMLNNQNQIKTYFLNIGNSGTIREGEVVVTMGSPLGYTNAVSYGIVSKRYANNKNYFLLDMRTNPGNSGGLIYSLDKQAVIGIAVAVYNSQDMQSEGMSVGIAIDAIKGILRKNGVKFTYHEEDQE